MPLFCRKNIFFGLALMLFSGVVLAVNDTAGTRQYPLSRQPVEAHAQAGDADAQYAWGYMLFYGKDGVTQNKKEAMLWFHKAAAKGQPQAMQALEIIRRAEHPQVGVAIHPKPHVVDKAAPKAMLIHETLKPSSHPDMPVEKMHLLQNQEAPKVNMTEHVVAPPPASMPHDSHISADEQAQPVMGASSPQVQQASNTHDPVPSSQERPNHVMSINATDVSPIGMEHHAAAPSVHHPAHSITMNHPAASQPTTADAKMPALPPRLFNQMIQRNHALLMKLPSGHFVVQLKASHQFETLLQYAQHDKRLLGVPSLHPLIFYRTDHGGKPWYVLLGGNYATHDEAKQAVALIDHELNTAQPFVKSMRSIQASLSPVTSSH